MAGKFLNFHTVCIKPYTYNFSHFSFFCSFDMLLNLDKNGVMPQSDYWWHDSFGGKAVPSAVTSWFFAALCSMNAWFFHFWKITEQSWHVNPSNKSSQIDPKLHHCVRTNPLLKWIDGFFLDTLCTIFFSVTLCITCGSKASRYIHNSTASRNRKNNIMYNSKNIFFKLLKLLVCLFGLVRGYDFDPPKIYPVATGGYVVYKKGQTVKLR